MTRWLAEYLPVVNDDLDNAKAGRELPCFRLYPEGEPERWVVATNPDLLLETQQEFAQIIAEFLSALL